MNHYVQFRFTQKLRSGSGAGHGAAKKLTEPHRTTATLVVEEREKLRVWRATRKQKQRENGVENQDLD